MKTYLILAAYAAGALAMSGCAGTVATPAGSASATVAAPTGLSGAVASVQSFTLADLKAADADAVAHNDTMAHNCWAGLQPIVANFQSPVPTTMPVGLASGVQAARDVVKFGEGLQGGLAPATRTAIAMACGPLALDAQTDINQGILAIGGTSINLLKIAPGL